MEVVVRQRTQYKWLAPGRVTVSLTEDISRPDAERLAEGLVGAWAPCAITSGAVRLPVRGAPAAELRFGGAGGLVGTLGCRQLSARYAAEGRQLSVTDIVARPLEQTGDRVPCGWLAEEVLGLLPAATEYELVDDHLFIDGGDVSIAFHRRT